VVKMARKMGKQFGIGNNFTLTKKLLIGFFAFCLCFLVYDIISGDLKNNLITADQTPLIGVQVDDIPDPNNNTENVMSNANKEFFANYRLEREQKRAEELSLLTEIIENNGSSTEAKALAEERRIAITAIIEKEMLAETILAAKNFGETAVLIQDNIVTVVLTGAFDEIKAAQVAEIVDSITGIGYENVVIINK